MSYFPQNPRDDAEARIAVGRDLPELPLVEGIRAKPIVGDRLNIQEVTLDSRAVAPVHTHDEEQLGYVVRGEIDFTDGKGTWRLGPGDFYVAPPGAPHGATALDEGCVVIDAFSPPREQVVKMLAEREG